MKEPANPHKIKVCAYILKKCRNALKSVLVQLGGIWAAAQTTKTRRNTMQKALIDKGVLRPSGEIVKDKINLISGAHTPPFVEMLWAVTNGDTDTTDRLYNILPGLYQDGRESEMLEVLRTLYGVLGLPFPEDVEQLAGHPEARGYFLFSFLPDFDDTIEDYRAEQDGT